MCISVLSYGALKGAMAGRFRNLLNSRLDELRKVNTTNSLSSAESASGETVLDDVLFDYVPYSSKLQDSARKLLNLIHRPFGGLEDIVPHANLPNRSETTMGTHLEWEWELRGDGCLHNMVELKDVCGSAGSFRQ
jgi:hypothetical protein